MRSIRNKHINIHNFFIKDQIDKGSVVVEHLPTNEIVSDYFTKPLQVQKFRDS